MSSQASCRLVHVFKRQRGSLVFGPARFVPPSAQPLFSSCFWSAQRSFAVSKLDWLARPLSLTKGTNAPESIPQNTDEDSSSISEKDALLLAIKQSVEDDVQRILQAQPSLKQTWQDILKQQQDLYYTSQYSNVQESETQIQGWLPLSWGKKEEDVWQIKPIDEASVVTDVPKTSFFAVRDPPLQTSTNTGNFFSTSDSAFGGSWDTSGPISLPDMAPWTFTPSSAEHEKDVGPISSAFTDANDDENNNPTVIKQRDFDYVNISMGTTRNDGNDTASALISPDDESDLDSVPNLMMKPSNEHESDDLTNIIESPYFPTWPKYDDEATPSSHDDQHATFPSESTSESDIDMEPRFPVGTATDNMSEFVSHRRDDPVKPSPYETTIDHGLALLMAMGESDWSLHDEAVDTLEGPDSVHDPSAVSGLDEGTETLVLDDRFSDNIAVDDDVHSSVDDVDILMQETGCGSIVLSTDQYNLLLLRLSVSNLCADDVIGNMTEVFQQMVEMRGLGMNTSAPNATTYTICMLVLSRRGQAHLAAVDICQNMIQSGVALTADAVDQGMECLQRRNCISDGETLLERAVREEINVSSKAYLSLLQMYKDENMQTKAFALLEACLKPQGNSGQTDYRSLNEIMFGAIDWPKFDRQGKRIDRAPHLEMIFDMLTQPNPTNEELSGWPSSSSVMSSFAPRFNVWKRIIVILSEESWNESNSDWRFVHKAFNAMRDVHHNYWPDPLLLKYGLRAAEATLDGGLAADLIVRAHESELGKIETVSSESTWTFSDAPWGSASDEDLVTSDDHIDERMDEQVTKPSSAIRLSPRAFASALQICVASGDMENASKVLLCLSHPSNHIPRSTKSELFTLAIKGYARIGDCDGAKQLLKEMQQDGPKPTEESYGAVIHSLAMAKKTEEANELLSAVESNEFGDGVKPGLACFTAAMLSSIRSHKWEDALVVRDKMKAYGIPPTPTCFQGVLLASFRLGDLTTAIQMVEDAIESNVSLDYKAYDASMKILLRNIIDHKSITETRNRLREFGEENVLFKPATINLSRALRAAEVEESRQPSKGLTSGEIMVKREKAWHEALKHLVQFVRSVEEHKESTSFSSG